MYTEKELESVLSSEKVSIEDVLYGQFSIEDIDGYFRREMKENLLEQGWNLPEELDDPDDDTAPVPEYLKVKPDPDKRSRYDDYYDGGELEEEPHYGSRLYWQWLAVKRGRLKYLRAYDSYGEEVKIPRGYGRDIFINIYDHLLGNITKFIRHKGYKLFKVDREDLDLEGLEDIKFFTCYLF